MKSLLNKVSNKINRIPIYIKIRNRLFHYKGADPIKVIIVGLPRSGTSFLTGLVVRMGFDPGPKDSLRDADELNPYGYYENNKLMKIDHNLLKKFSGDAMSPPKLPINWIDLCIDEQIEIESIIEQEGIEVYKGNMLIVLADLYHQLFPNVKWIFISRNQQEIVRSILHADKSNRLNNNYLIDLTNNWNESWKKTKVSSKCLNIKYEDFFNSPQKAIEEISHYLDRDLSQEKLNTCLNFFKPNVK